MAWNQHHEKGGASHARYERYKGTETIAEALRAGARRKDLSWDLERGLLRLHPPPPEVEVGAPEEASSPAFVYDEWLAGRLKVLPKKGDLSDPNSWRGIMLLDAAGKILSSIVSARLQGLLAEEGAEDGDGGGCASGFVCGESCDRSATGARTSHATPLG